MPGSKPALLDWMRGAPPIQSASRERCAIDGATIEYTLKRSQRRRRITLTIDEDGLRVGAPWRASKRVSMRLCCRMGAGSRASSPNGKAADLLLSSWQAGATVMALGEPLTLVADAAIKVTYAGRRAPLGERGR